jgi:hypothetical protein
LAFQALENQQRGWFTRLEAECVDAFDTRVRLHGLERCLHTRVPDKRGPKRVHFVECVTFAALLPRNMLYRGGFGTRWHVGCNYLITRTTRRDFKKRRHGSGSVRRKEIAADTGYG